MTIPYFLLALVIGLALGAVVAWLWTKAQVEKLGQDETTRLSQELNDLKARHAQNLAELQNKLTESSTALGFASQRQAELNLEIDRLRQHEQTLLTGLQERERQLASAQTELQNLGQRLAETQQLLSVKENDMASLRLRNEQLGEQFAKEEAKRQALETQHAKLLTDHQELNKKAEDWQQQMHQAQQQAAAQAQQIETLDKLRQESSLALQQQLEQLKLQFGELSKQALDDNRQRFGQDAEQFLGQVRERLKELGEKVSETHEKGMERNTELRTQIDQLMQHSKLAVDSASQLADALRGESKTRGNWGEIILERLLEASGLEKGTHFELQYTVDVEGETRYPDAVIFLPDEKHLIVDSKVSLVAYDRFHNAATEEERLHALKTHLDSVRMHIKQLSEKNYTRASKLNPPDFVLLFMPIEAAFQLALQHDDKLYEYAAHNRILLVGPYTLTGTAMMIHTIWRHFKQNKNVMEIAEEAGKLYDKFVGFIDTMDKVGRALDSAQQAYSTARNQLDTGKGNITSRFETLKSLGAKTRKKLDQKTAILSNGDFENVETAEGNPE